MSDVVAEISMGNNDANGDVALPTESTHNTSDSLLISSSPVTLAASSIPVSSTATNILIPSETGLPSSETATALDVIPNDESEGTTVASNGTQGERQNDAPVAIVASDNSFILDSSQAIELNGEKHEIVQQIQDPDSGDILVVLKSESGKHVALPLSTFTEGVDMASHDVGDNESVLPQASSEAATTNLDAAIVFQAENDESCVLNVAQSDKMQSNSETFNANAQKEDTSSSAPVIPVPSSEDGANNETLQSFVPAASATDGSESYVIMSSSDGSAEQVNLADVIGRPDGPGQTYLIETAEGLVACSSASSDTEKSMTDAVSNVAPILATSDLSTATTTEYVENDMNTSTEEAILQAVTSSGNIVDGQIIQAVVGSQTVSYQIAATENGIQLIPVESVETPAPVATPAPSTEPAKKPTPHTRTRTSSNNSNTLLSDQPSYSAKRTKQNVGKNSKASTVAETRTPEYKMHSSYTKSTSKSSASLFTPTNSSSLIGDSLGPSQLASSHRTYSRKNILWVNPETNQSASTSTSSASSTTQSTSTTSATSTTATPTTSKTVSFAPKATNSSPIELTSPISQKTSSSSASTSSAASTSLNASKKSDAEAVHKKVSPIVKSEKEASNVSPSKVVRTSVSARRSAVKSPERAKQLPPPPPPSVTVTEEKPEKQNSTKESDSQANNHLITVEVVSQVESESQSPNKECPKEALVEQSQQVDETPTSAKRRRGRPSKRSLVEEPAGKTDVENTLSGSSKRSKAVETTKSEEQSSGRESRRTRRTPKRYTSDDENSSEAEKGDKNSSDATETNKQISISSATEYKANSNCETIQDSIHRLSPPKVNVAVTNDTSEPSVIGNDAVAEPKSTTPDVPNESNSISNSNSVTEVGQVSTNCELTLDSSNSATECEVNETTPSSKTGSNRPIRKGKKQVGFKDLTQESSESSELESVTSTSAVATTTSNATTNSSTSTSTTTPATTLSTRKRVQITTDVNGSEECTSPRAKKSPVTSDLKLTPILKTTSKYSPIVRGKRLDTAVVCSFSPTDQEVIHKRLRDSVSSLSDTRSPAEKYDLVSSDCSIHVRVQPSALLYKPGSDSTYICQKCGYTTSRLNNLIFHHKDQCSVVQHAVRQLWAHEIRMQTKSNLNTSTSTSTCVTSATTSSYIPNQNSPLSSSSLFAEVSSPSNSFLHHETGESPQLSDLGI